MPYCIPCIVAHPGKKGWELDDIIDVDDHATECECKCGIHKVKDSSPIVNNPATLSTSTGDSLAMSMNPITRGIVRLMGKLMDAIDFQVYLLTGEGLLYEGQCQ
jgi:hypothetical protein